MPVKHWAYCERLVSAAAAEVGDEVLAEAPWIEDSDPRLARLCRATARSNMLSDWILRLADEEGVEAVPPTVWSEARAAAETVAQRMAGHLGLTGLGLAKMMRRAYKAEDWDRLILLGLRMRVKTAQMPPEEVAFALKRLGQRYAPPDVPRP